MGNLRYVFQLCLLSLFVSSLCRHRSFNLQPRQVASVVARPLVKAESDVKVPSVCEGYDGILFISNVIKSSGAGTLFFISIVNSLIYAQTYNLLPFIHINNDRNWPCYDTAVHGVGHDKTYQHVYGTVTDILGSGNMTCWNKRGTARMTSPGPPDTTSLIMQNFTLVGNGLWNSYYESIPAKNPLEDASCQATPVYEMSYKQIYMQTHRCWMLAVRSWPFQHLPKALTPADDESIHDWLGDHRDRASRIVHKHFRLLPSLQDRVNEANPEPRACLAVHIRLTDKASGRDKKGLNAYLPYMEEYAAASSKDGSPIYIATDDARILGRIKQAWSNETSSRIIVQPGVMRSTSDIPTFEILENDKHRSNIEALVEIYSMARCTFFVHGFSGMSEAVVYINPALHNRSVNIDDENKMTPREFGSMVQNVLRSTGAL